MRVSLFASLVLLVASTFPQASYAKCTTILGVRFCDAKPRSSGVSSAKINENKAIQTALNFFGFDVGTVDGQLGRGSKSAIMDYQAFLNYPVTGNLTDAERLFLVSSRDRALAGGTAQTQIAINSPGGIRGLLKTYKNETAVADSGGQAPVTKDIFAPTERAVSIANFCNQVTLNVSLNGGYATVNTMADPEEALGEQFCLARSFAIKRSNDLILSNAQGITSEQMKVACQSLVPSFSKQVSAISLGKPEEVLASTTQVILTSGRSPNEMVYLAEICLGIGYQTDDTPLALSSSLMLAALGKMPYAELMGHHLAKGFGTLQRNDLAAQWYGSAVDAVEGGQQAIFAPSQTERMQLIRLASGQIGSNSTPGGTENTFKMPTFGNTNE